MTRCILAKTAAHTSFGTSSVV